MTNIGEKIINIVEKIGIGLTTFIFVVSLIQVVMRYIFQVFLWQASELIRFSIIWMVMLYGGVLNERKRHFQLCYFMEILEPRLPKIVVLNKLFVSILLLGFFVIMIYLAGYSAVNAFSQRTATLGVSMFFPVASIFVGFSLCLFFQFFEVIGIIRNLNK